MAEWAGVVNTRSRDYAKGASDETMRNRKYLAMLDSKGRVEYNAMHGDGDHQWQVEFSGSQVNSYADGQSVAHTRTNRWKKLTVNTRGYMANDLMTIKEFLTRGGPNQLVDRYANIIPLLLKDVKNQLGLELYVDGYAAGNENRFIGMDSFCGTGTTVAADLIAKPDDSYGGLDTDAGSYGGTWSANESTSPNASIATDWPYGLGDPQYDFNSPKLVNWSSTSWGTSSTTWEDNCEKALRQAADWCVVTGGQDGSLDMFLLESKLFTQFKNKFAGRERVMIDANSPLRKYGFTDVMNLDGVEVTSEYGIASNTGYGLNFDEMTLMFVQDQMYEVMGPEWDPSSASWVYSIFSFGNMKFRPKAFCKLKNFA